MGVGFTVTVKEQKFVFLEASVPLHVTVVVPSGNTEPEAGIEVLLVAPGQLSVIIGAG